VSITREQWQAISPLLAEAMELPERARGAWLAELDHTQPALSPLLRRLLHADSLAEQGHAFETVSALAGPREPACSNLAAGQQVGPYVLERLIGRGGMGEVWLARQVEGGLTRDVALKLPLLPGGASPWRERFRRERDILARLQHPHIATLFEAGVAETGGTVGQPYFAMEYVDGTTLLEHATQRALPVRGQLELFRQVLEAVGCAHRQLVIHRDLKPSNILVTSDGQVKLLDFGIAKLLEAETGPAGPDDLTQIDGRLLTYRYAAPEQVHGGTLGTATDVYALGVLLHELLTGLSPYRRIRGGEAPGMADFAQQDFALPSSLVKDKALARTLAGDLDAIILKALRRVPADRYGTVEQFDDDLRRHLELRPVLALRGSRRYRVGRFITRNRLPLAAATLVAASLVAGLVVAERQRRVAVAAQARAERHFASVRGLANTFIFDIERQLEGVAGTLPVRQQLADTAVKYLDGLANETTGDPALAAELAGGYLRMGEVLGGISFGNLGRWDDALAAYEKASRLLDGLGNYADDKPKVLNDIIRLRSELYSQYAQRKDPRWEAESLKGIAALRTFSQLRGNTAADRVHLASRLIEHVNVLALFSISHALGSPMLREGEQLLAAAEPDIGTDERSRRNLAASNLRIAEILSAPGATPSHAAEALPHARRAVEVFGALASERPGDTDTASLQQQARGAAVAALLILERPADAEREIQPALVNLAALSAKDPNNMDSYGNLWAAYTLAVETAFRSGHPELARQRASEGRARWQHLPKAIQDASTVASYKLKLDYFGGLALLAEGPRGQVEACQSLRNAKLTLEALLKISPETITAGFEGLSAALARCPGDAGMSGSKG
jgi:serine/threonine protein kinase